MMRDFRVCAVALLVVVCPIVEARPAPKPKAPPEAPSVSKRGPTDEMVAVSSPIVGVAIVGEAQGEASWKLTLRNNTDALITIVWDESTFVAGDGKSWGRLVPSATRMIDVEKSHAPSPLAPHATLDETVIPESRVALGGFGYDWRREIDGGRLYLTVQIGNEKKAWTATVTESAVTSLGWWCWSSEIEGRKSGPKCSRTRDRCDEDRAPVLRLAHLGTKVTECAAHTGSAWCLIAKMHAGDRISPCWDSEERCRTMTSDQGHEKATIEVGCTERP